MANKANLGDLYTSNNEFDANVMITVGNTVANVLANSTHIILANTTSTHLMNPLNISVGNTTANLRANSISVSVGNTVANLLANSSIIRIANSTLSANLLPGQLTLANATHIANITPAGIVAGAVSVTFDAVPAPQGRLSANSTNPIDDGAVATARTTIYYHPYVGNLCPNYNGTDWEVLAIADAGISIALESNASNTGYHQSGKIFDLYLYNDSGTTRLVTGPAWTSDIARAQALTRSNGFLVNSGSQTARYGTGTASTVTMAATRGTYLGTFRATAGGSTQFYKGAIASGGAAAAFALWNMYNRLLSVSLVGDNGVSYTATTAGRAARNSANMRCSFITGIEDTVPVIYKSPLHWSGGAWTDGASYIGVTLDQTSGSPSTESYTILFSAGGDGCMATASHVYRLLGWHFISAWEGLNTTATAVDPSSGLSHLAVQING